MTAALATARPLPVDLERVLIAGDLSRLTPEQRVAYYNRVCESVGLNPLTKPFEYLKLSGKEVLYARKDATDQLRKIYGISVLITSRERHDDLYVVTARATTPDGRTDESIGAVAIGGLKGENLANALMKTETKAKRRATLSICGLGILDETEVDSVPGAQRVPLRSVPSPTPHDPETGEVLEVASEAFDEMVAKYDAARTLDELTGYRSTAKKLYEQKRLTADDMRALKPHVDDAIARIASAAREQSAPTDLDPDDVDLRLHYAHRIEQATNLSDAVDALGAAERERSDGKLSSADMAAISKAYSTRKEQLVPTHDPEAQ